MRSPSLVYLSPAPPVPPSSSSGVVFLPFFLAPSPSPTPLPVRPIPPRLVISPARFIPAVISSLSSSRDPFAVPPKVYLLRLFRLLHPSPLCLLPIRGSRFPVLRLDSLRESSCFHLLCDSPRRQPPLLPLRVDFNPLSRTLANLSLSLTLSVTSRFCFLRTQFPFCSSLHLALARVTR